jgi:hypothetical protein
MHRDLAIKKAFGIRWLTGYLQNRAFWFEPCQSGKGEAMGYPRRLWGAELALRAAGGLLALASMITFFSVPAEAQQTQT